MSDVASTPSEPDGDRSTEILRIEHIRKSFGAVVALRDINLHLNRGEVLGLVGDNGTGKSTLVKVLSGFHRPDAGRILIEGTEVTLHSVRDARRQGIETVYQDLALIPQMSIYHNLFLNREMTFGGPVRMLSNRKMRRLAAEYLADIRVSIPDIDATVEQLSGGQRQAIAVARATRSEVKILLLDEPLAAMGAKESSLIIDLIRDLSARGVSLVIIDHNYTHLFELCDRLNVIEQGQITLDTAVRDTSLEELTAYMVTEYRKQIMAGRPDASS